MNIHVNINAHIAKKKRELKNQSQKQCSVKNVDGDSVRTHLEE